MDDAFTFSNTTEEKDRRIVAFIYPAVVVDETKHASLFYSVYDNSPALECLCGFSFYNSHSIW